MLSTNLFTSIAKKYKYFNSETIFLSAIILIAIIFRLKDIDFIKPYFLILDEYRAINASLTIIQTGNLHPNIQIYGSFPIYFFSFLYLIILGFLWLFTSNLNFSDYIANINPYSSEILLSIGRYSSLIFSLISILLCYKIAKILFNRNTALLAAIFLALSPLHILFSVIFKYDMFLLLWILLSFYFSLKILHQDNRKYYFFTGIFIGMSLATKYNFFTYFPLFVAHLIRKKHFKSFFDFNIFIACYVSIVTFSILCPFIFLDSYNYISKLLYEFKIVQQFSPFANIKYANIIFSPFFTQIFILFPLIINPFIFIYSILGIWIFATNNYRFLFHFLSFPILYFLFTIISSSIVAPYFYLPILPYLTILGSLVIQYYYFNKNKIIKYLNICFLFFIILFYLSNLFVPHYLSHFQVIESAIKWTKDNIPKDKTVISHWGLINSGKFEFKEIYFMRNSVVPKFGLNDVDYYKPDYLILLNYKSYSTLAPSYWELISKLKEDKIPNYRRIKEFKGNPLWLLISSKIFPDLDASILIFKKIS